MKRLKKVSYDEFKDYTLDSLQEDLKGEEKAIFQYQEHIKYIDDPEIKAKLTEIMKEEEHHAQELRELINKINKTAK